MSALAGIDVDPISARIMFLCRMGIIRELSAEEKLELQQLQAAEKAEPQAQETLQ